MAVSHHDEVPASSGKSCRLLFPSLCVQQENPSFGVISQPVKRQARPMPFRHFLFRAKASFSQENGAKNTLRAFLMLDCAYLYRPSYF